MDWIVPPAWLVTFGPEGDAGPHTLSPVAAFTLRGPETSASEDSAGPPRAETLFPPVSGENLDVTFRARLDLQTAGTYRFGAEVAGGTCEIEVVSIGLGRKTLTIPPDRSGSMTDPLRLEPGRVMLRYRFRRDGAAPARLRAMWAREAAGAAGFGPEPIPASAVRVPEDLANDARRALATRRGLQLLGEFGCISCHDPGQAADELLLARSGPDLAGIGDRASAEWLRTWIQSPRLVKSHAVMPDLFYDAEGDEADLEALIAYLASLGGVPSTTDTPWSEPGSIDRGRTLYAEVGCIACHGTVSGAGDPPNPFGALRGKWTHATLSRFLHDPSGLRPHGRMPAMALDETEARHIATYMLGEWGGGATPASSTSFAPDLVTAGREAFVARGCVSCHAVAGQPPESQRLASAKPLGEVRLGRGCMDPADPGTPRYGLEPPELDALSLAIATLRGAGAGAPARPYAASMRIETFGCLNCHEWNARGGVRDVVRDQFRLLVEADLGDEGRLPPTLTGAGSKLTWDWAHQVLFEAGRARPYMATRMPQFGEEILGDLASGLAAIDGAPPRDDSFTRDVTDEMIEAGHTLAGENGLNCISCHVFGDLPPAGTPGPDMTRFAERLRYDWWRRYARNPARLKPGTRMPAFFVTGTSAVTSVYGGDADRQIDALWAYFTLADDMPVPEGLQTDTGGYAIRVTDRPVVMRTFIEGVGSRAIAVGFPQGIHFAFDARAARLAEVWRGDFLDASGIWANRGGTPTGGRGPIVWRPDPGAGVAITRASADPPPVPQEASFKGYALDDAGVPTFRYEMPTPSGSIALARERIAPGSGASELRRSFVVSGLSPGEVVWCDLARVVEGVAQGSEGTLVEQRTSPDGSFLIRAQPPAGATTARFEVTIVLPRPDDSGDE